MTAKEIESLAIEITHDYFGDAYSCVPEPELREAEELIEIGIKKGLENRDEYAKQKCLEFRQMIDIELKYDESIKMSMFENDEAQFIADIREDIGNIELPKFDQ
jgi:hypothetical protein